MQCLRIPTPWVHWQKEDLQEPSGNSPSSLQMWFLQFSCSVVVVSSEGELVVSFAKEAERATGIRAKRSSFMVENLNLVILSFLDLEVLLKFSWLWWLLLEISSVTLACVAPLFYTELPKLIKTYFT